MPLAESPHSASELLRLHDGSEVIVSVQGLVPGEMESFVEDHIWTDVYGGARLPGVILEAERAGSPSFAAGCIERPLRVTSLKQWDAAHPKVSPSYQRYHEEQTGMKLILAEKRMGSDYLRDLDRVQPVKELILEGWTRTNDGQLVEDDSEDDEDGSEDDEEHPEDYEEDI